MKKSIYLYIFIIYIIQIQYSYENISRKKFIYIKVMKKIFQNIA